MTQRVLFSAALGAVVAALLGLVLTSCSGTTPPALQEVPGGGAVSAPASPSRLKVADPFAITIPRIGAHSTLVPLGLTAGRELEVPPVDEPEQAGWYAGEKTDVDGDEYKPGEVGPAVIAGHVDGLGPDGRKGFPGIFARLGELAPGDEVLVDRADGSQLKFVVTEVQRYSKAAFPSEKVYGPTDKPELRLITCGGDFDRSSGHYLQNTVAFATLAPEQL